MVARGDALDDAIRRIEADPVALEIMWSRLVNVTEEMWSTVVRTAFSLTMSESQDFACELLDARGEALAHSPQAMPVFNLTLPRAVQELLKIFPAAALAPGDVLVTNDPWIGVGHLYDFIIVTPVFRDGLMVALAGSIGHVTDIGGTKNALGARELYEEGLQVPPMKLYKAGVENEDLVRIIRENVRDPDQVLGDVHALVEANARGAERLLRFMDEYGMHDLGAIAAVVQRRAESAMREAVRDLCGRRLSLGNLQQSARRSAPPAAADHGCGRHHDARLRRRAAATAARRTQRRATTTPPPTRRIR